MRRVEGDRQGGPMGIEEDRRGGSRRRIEEDCVSSVLGPTGTPQGAKRVRGVLISEGGGGGMYAVCLMLYANAPIGALASKSPKQL